MCKRLHWSDVVDGGDVWFGHLYKTIFYKENKEYKDDYLSECSIDGADEELLLMSDSDVIKWAMGKTSISMPTICLIQDNPEVTAAVLYCVFNEFGGLGITVGTLDEQVMVAMASSYSDDDISEFMESLMLWATFTVSIGNPVEVTDDIINTSRLMPEHKGDWCFKIRNNYHGFFATEKEADKFKFQYEIIGPAIAGAYAEKEEVLNEMITKLQNSGRDEVSVL